MEDIVILGYGGHAKSVVDCIVRNGQYHIVGYTDVHKCDGRFEYLGTDDVLKELYLSGIRLAALGVGYIGDSYIRDRLVNVAKAYGFKFPIIADPSAILADDVIVGEGSFIGKKSVVNVGARIGNFCIANTGAIIEHENEVGDYSHVAVGSLLCGNVRVGHHSFIGAGATVIQGKSIGNNCIIGANSTILADVEDNMKVYGIVKNVARRV